MLREVIARSLRPFTKKVSATRLVAVLYSLQAPLPYPYPLTAEYGLGDSRLSFLNQLRTALLSLLPFKHKEDMVFRPNVDVLAEVDSFRERHTLLQEHGQPPFRGCEVVGNRDIVMQDPVIEPIYEGGIPNLILIGEADEVVSCRRLGLVNAYH